MITVEQVEGFLRLSGKTTAGNRMDITIDGDSFQAVEVLPDLSTGRRFAGSAMHGGLSIQEDPELTFEQARVYDIVWKRVEERLQWADDSGLIVYELLRFGDNPELFDLQYTRPNIAGNIYEELRPVWAAIDAQLASRGKRAIVQLAPKEAKTGDDMRVNVMPSNGCLGSLSSH